METTTKTLIEEYKNYYHELQKEWKSRDKELLLVGRLAYWTYWISKYAENSKGKEERSKLFNLKRNGLLLLTQSKYTQIRRHVPEVHRKLCYKHSHKRNRKNGYIGWFLDRYQDELKNCEKCKKNEEHYYSLYSVAILNGIGDEEKKPIFIFYSPYRLLKEQFPPLEELRSVKKYNGRERGIKNINLGDGFSVKLCVKKFIQNYEELQQYLAAK